MAISQRRNSVILFCVIAVVMMAFSMVMPILPSMLEAMGGSGRDIGLSAAAFHPSLKRRPETKLVIYHGSTHEESAYQATSFRNVHVEPSWLGFFPHLFQLMRKLGGYRKMLAGTDGPGWFDSFDGSPYEDLVQLARQHLDDDETVRDFCARNARRLLGIAG